MQVNDIVNVRLVKNINGKPSNQSKYLKGTIVKVNNKTVNVRLNKDGSIINRRMRDINGAN